MHKNTVMIISIISTTISMIYIILSYLGIMRYIYLLSSFSSIDDFANEYHSLEKVSKSHRVIISMSVNDKNISKMKPVLKSILDQTVKVDEISINIPHYLKDKIPDYLSKYSNTYNTINDYGDCNTIIPTLIREKDKDTIVIFLTPEFIYGQNFISDIYDEYIKLSKNNSKLILHNKCKSDNFTCPIILQIGSITSTMKDLNINETSTSTCNFIINNLNTNVNYNNYNYSENYKY